VTSDLHLFVDLNTDELKAKRANRERVKTFAKNLHEYNQNVIDHTRLVSISNDCADGERAKKILQIENSARQRALDFAKGVPKPRIAVIKNEVNESNIIKINSIATLQRAKDNLVTADEDRRMSKILELESRHTFDKQKVNHIKKSMGL
jgi:Jhy protein